MTTELTAIRKKLEKKLKEERYIHTLGVMYTAASMAMRHGADVQKAMTAGLCMIVENIATSMNRSCSAGSITLNCQMPNWRFLR